MQFKTSLAFVLASSFLPLWPAVAHHSLAVFARSRSETIEGTVKSFSWSNPHVQIVLLTADADGAMRQWNFEGGSTSRLATAGFVVWPAGVLSLRLLPVALCATLSPHAFVPR